VALRPQQDGRLMVMVVDDSITVRKVTTRLLERNGYQVLTAKDGVDAMGQLQEVMPDMLLLDIEMPRMDGFELATHMRNDERLRHVPIIMITSRTGDKHRERAREIGVNQYLGKPYQESMLDSIRLLSASTRLQSLAELEESHGYRSGKFSLWCRCYMNLLLPNVSVAEIGSYGLQD
jgi:CheY-like chemotaxis protein